MPQPPLSSSSIKSPVSDPVALLTDLHFAVLQERTAAQERHREILDYIRERSAPESHHQDILKKHYEQHSVLQDILARLPTHNGHLLPVTVTPCPHSIGADAPAKDEPSTQDFSKKRNINKQLSRKASLGIVGGKANLADANQQGLSHAFITHVVEHRYFEMFVGCMIIGNALVMVCEVERKGVSIACDLKHKACVRGWSGAETVLLIVDWCFGIMFALEVIIKVVVYHKMYFCNLWHCFDTLCVVTFLIDKLASAVLPIDAQTLRLLRLGRLMRILRLLRAMESLDVLYVMATAIKGMRHVVVWGMALLGVLLMMCALVINIVLQGGYFENSGSISDEDLAKKVKMYQYFGTFSRCLFSMFELTLANWPPVARLLSEEITEWFMIICVLHKLTIGFAVVGVINGVILQETFKVAGSDDMIMVRQKRRDQASLRRKLSALFEALDHSEDGELDYEEFELIATHPEIQLWLAAMDIETDDLRLLFDLIDADGNGTVTPMELMTRIPRLKGAARAIDMLALCKRTIGSHYNERSGEMLCHP